MFTSALAIVAWQLAASVGVCLHRLMETVNDDAANAEVATPAMPLGNTEQLGIHPSALRIRRRKTIRKPHRTPVPSLPVRLAPTQPLAA
jgi:hypothetical protein